MKDSENMATDEKFGTANAFEIENRETNQTRFSNAPEGRFRNGEDWSRAKAILITVDEVCMTCRNRMHSTCRVDYHRIHAEELLSAGCGKWEVDMDRVFCPACQSAVEMTEMNRTELVSEEGVEK